MNMTIKRLSLTLAVILTFSQAITPFEHALAEGETIATEGNQVVEIPDLELRAAINYHLYKIPGAEIYKSELESFETLNLSGKNIRNLEGLQYAINLQELVLNGNQIMDLKPLSNLQNLKKLYLSGNQIADISPLSNLLNLTHLDIENNQISDISSLENFTQLYYLMAERNQITDLKPLTNLTNLDVLYLTENNITDISPLSRLVNLRTLSLSDNDITDFQPIENMSVLGSLSLSNNNIEDISFLSNMNDLLMNVNLSDNHIKDISPIAGLTKMYSLNLTNNEIANIDALSNMTRLQHLQLRDNKIRDLSPLKYTLNNMKYMDLAYNVITDISVIENSGVYIRDINYEGNFIPSKDKQFQYVIPSNSQYQFIESLGENPIEIPIELLSEANFTYDKSKGIPFKVEIKNNNVEAVLVGDEKVIIRGVTEGEDEVILSFLNPQLNQTITINQVDLTAPPAPQVERVTDQYGEIRGTTEKYAKIIIKIGNEQYETASYNEGAFFKQIPLQQAGTEMYVFSKDLAGNISEPTKVIVEDVTGPVLRVNNEVTNRSQEVTGSSEPGAKINIRANDLILGETTTGSDGAFQIAIPAQEAGTRITISSTDAAGNETVSSLDVRDVIPPEKPIVYQVTEVDRVVTGQAEADSSVIVKKNGVIYGSNRSDTDGIFTVSIPAQEAGTELVVEAIDNSGNLSEPTTVVVKDVIAPNKIIVNEVTDQAEAVSGEAEAGSKVDVKKNNSVVGSAIADMNGQFTVTIPAQIAGSQLVITATDDAGNISDPANVVVKDVTPPTAPNVNPLTNRSTKVSGKAEGDATVIVKIESEELSVKAESDGSFVKTIPAQKAGTLVKVSAKDASGNISKPTSIKVVSTVVNRIEGSDRYKTAVQISKSGWNTAETVVLAKGSDFPDALAGGPLAYKENAPILLTETNKITKITKDEIVRLKAKKVIILGRETAVSNNVSEELRSIGLKIERIGGNDRYHTAALIAEKIDSNQAIVAYGKNFPDALSIAPYAAKNGIPILLTDTNKLPYHTMTALKGKSNTIVVGQESVVGKKVENQLPDTSRYGGSDRYSTAKDIIMKKPLGFNHAYVVTGSNFPDALAGSVLAAKNNAPILLVKNNSIPTPIKDLLGKFEDFEIIGGGNSVGDEVKRKLEM